MKNLKKQQQTKQSTLVRSKVKSCYGCIYLTFPRHCDWFRLRRHMDKKEIPLETMKKGCKFREPMTVIVKDPSGLITKLIDKFDGELI
jgi:hypothetical protein